MADETLTLDGRPPYAVRPDLVLLDRDPQDHPFELPLVLGHEIAGVVSETGNEVDEDLRGIIAALAQRARKHVDAGLAQSLEQLASYGDPDRDPRGRIVSVAWLAVVPQGVEPTAGSDAAGVAWKPVSSLLRRGKLAFDHRQLLADGVERACSKLEYTALATAFVDEEFTIAELRRVYEVVWGLGLDPGNFHRKVTRAGVLEATGRNVQRGPGRPAALYRHVRGADELYPPLTRSALR